VAVMHHSLREWLFTQLTLKLSEVIGGCNAVYLFLYLAINPSLQAI
jgi:hypothetical protein